MLFKYHTRDANGKAVNGEIEAMDEREAVSKLQAQGLIVISVEKISENVVKVEKEILNENKGSIPQQNKKKLNTILITIGVLLFIFAILGLKNYLEFKIYYHNASPLVAEWVDTLNIVGSTPRIALSQPVSKLQEIRRKFEKLYVPDKYRECNKYFIAHMEDMISGCLAFMQNNEEEAAKFFFNAGLLGKKASDCLYPVYKLDFRSVSLLNAHLQANESAARAALMTITTAEIIYRSVYPTYATLPELGSPKEGPAFISINTGCPTPPCTKDGYKFNTSDITTETFHASAVPVASNVTGVHSFCVTEDGVLRVNDKGGVIDNRAACLNLPEAPRP